MNVQRAGYQHKIPDDERDEHTLDGPWCVCAPRQQNLPLVVANREGYAAIIHHVSKAHRKLVGILR